MYCSNCGYMLDSRSHYCTQCGKSAMGQDQSYGISSSIKERHDVQFIGFSSKIHDPALKKYIKNSNRWSALFSAIIAVIAVGGFFIYGESSSEMDNPQALYIGLTIGGMFLLIALFQIIGRKRSKTWDGTVVDKQIENKRRKRSYGNNDYYWEVYTVYEVFIREENGRIHTIRVEDDDTVYNYYRIGDRVRHHAGLNTYEKFDKSIDEIIFCNACATLNSISDEKCSRCSCPLLK